jgi:hypothetical protein
MEKYLNVVKETINEVKTKVYENYVKEMTLKSRLLDCYIMYSFLTAAIQALYVVFVGTFPFNSFLSSFICHLGMAVLGISLRYQKDEEGNPIEKAVYEFIFCNLVLFFIVFSFMG